MAKNYYKILEINETATAEEIKRAYRKLALKWHPDKWANKSLEERQQANEKIQEINRAYEILGDEEKKRRYDLGQTEFSTTDDFDLKEWIRRENERINEEIGEIDDRLEKIKKLLKELAREEVAGNIRSEMLLNGVSRKRLDGNLWSPCGSIEEKVWNIEIGDDENDREGIDKRKLNEFKEKMIKAIREKKIQLTAEKMAKASSDLERVRLKVIKEIEEELQNRGLKIEDLEEKYHNYEEEINGLTKKFKIYSYEDEVIEVIRRKSQSGSSREFKLKNSDFSWEESEQPDKGTRESNYTPLNDDKKPYKELEKITDKKEPQKSSSKYDNLTKEELIRRIEELEEEIKQLKSEKVEKDELPEFQIILSKKEEELKNSKARLISISSDTNSELKKPNPKLDNDFSSGWLIGGGVLLAVGLLAILVIERSKKKKN